MEQKNDFFIQTTLTPEQARVVIHALDLLSRLHCGQFREIGWLFRSQIKEHDLVDRLLAELKQECHPGLKPTHSYGIAECPTESARIAWDILQVVRKAEAYSQHPEGGLGMRYSDPMFISDSRPRPTAKIATILDRLAGI